MEHVFSKGTALGVIQTLESLEADLGDPWCDSSAVTFQQLMADDEAAAYPQVAYEALIAQDLNARLVPEALGGKLYACHESLLYFRTLARRCCTLATVALLPNIGYFAVLIAGSDEQKQRFAKTLMNGDAMCWGLSEKTYGSDVLSNATHATTENEDYRISGTKWPIGLADRARMMVVQARTGEGPSPAAHTLLVFDRAEADRRTWHALPNEALHGVRGLPLGGVRYENAPVRAHNRIGEEGRSLEIILRAHQILRIGVSSTTLGTTDTALRIAVGFARERTLFGDPIIALPITRKQLADGFADLFLCEVLLMAAARSLHVAPKRLYLQASIAKYFVPTTTEAAMQTLSALIGARYFLRSNFAKGVFQKMLRDGAMASFVDGNTLVNLRVIGSQMPLAFKRIAGVRESGLSDNQFAALEQLYDPMLPVGPARWTELDLQNNGLDLNLVGLRTAITMLKGKASTKAIGAARALEQEVDSLMARYETQHAAYGRDFMQSAAFYDLAKQYCLLSAGAAVVQYAVHGHASVPPAIGAADWLSYCLSRILTHFNPLDASPSPSATDAMLDALTHLYDENRAFSPLPYRYAGETQTLSEMEALHA